MYNPAATGRKLNIPEAIARQEGWNIGPDVRCRRNHNPGNIDYGQFAQLHGGFLEAPLPGAVARFAAWSTDEAGFGALVALCRVPKYRGGTLMHLISAWAPPSENNTAAYLTEVTKLTGLGPLVIIDAYLDPVE